MVKGGVDNRSSRCKRTKKRKFYGNRHTRKAVTDLIVPPESHIDLVIDEDPSTSHTEVNVGITTVSEKKIIPCCGEDLGVNDGVPLLLGNRIFDISLLSNIFKKLPCPSCYNQKLTLVEISKQGLAFKFELKCNECEWSHSFWNSKKKKKKRNFDINTRVCYSMRRIGKGHQGLKKFLYLMNHPPPMTEKNYRKMSYKLHAAIKCVATDVMKEACMEIIASDSNNTDGIHETAVSVDGTWQRRGFSSLNGAVAALSIQTGKVLDIAPLSRYCQTCINIRKLEKSNPTLFIKLNDEHACNMNHTGSAPAMETEGAKLIFERSIQKNNICYTEYYGDGDTKSHVKVADTYKDIGKAVIKKECIGHVQKRVGCRLRKLRKVVPGIGGKGKGKLKDKVIDKLQNYYGIAIRSNLNDKSAMKKAIGASLFHVGASAETQHEYHIHCPDGGDSWCLYKADKANNTSNYKPGEGIEKEILLKHVKPIFAELSKDELLDKCLDGKTQNQNESYNGMIWKRIPKDTFVKRTQFEIGVYDSVAHFNIGNLATLLIYDKSNIERGYYTVVGCTEDNQYRTKNAKRLSSDTFKSRRRFLRGKRKSKGDKTRVLEGKLYGPGEF